MLKEMLLEMKYDEQAKEEFVPYCHDENNHNNARLHAVDDFKRDYHSYSPIWWYTKEPFIYLVLNRALRMQNIEVVLKMGFCVRDLHQQIEQLYSTTDQRLNLVLFRGQGMSTEKFEKMNKNEGGLLAFNNFLSTSYDEQVSRAFAASSLDDPDLTGILFRIEMNPLMTSVPFAPLDNIIYYSDSEKEILFSMHTVFKIGSMQRIQERLWQVQLKLTSDNDEQLKRLTERVHYETRGPTGSYRLGTLMIKMGEFEKAELFFRTLIDKTRSNNFELLAHLYNQLGFVYQSKGNCASALVYFDKARDAKQKFLPLNHLDFSTIYNNIAMVYETIGGYSTALSYYQKTLEIQQKFLPSTHCDLGTTYNNIGLVHRSIGNASNALSYFQKSLEIQVDTLPLTLPNLASTYCNIGGMYQLWETILLLCHISLKHLIFNKNLYHRLILIWLRSTATWV